MFITEPICRHLNRSIVDRQQSHLIVVLIISDIQIRLMPILKRYVESSEKDGCYVHAYIKSQSHPLPLQTPDVTEKIYSALGYEPSSPGPNDGVSVPNELTWALYNVGLHWTESTGPRADPTDLNIDLLRESSGPTLRDEDINTISTFAETYRGPDQAKVAHLSKKLTGDSPRGESSERQNPDETASALESIIDSFDETLKKTNSSRFKRHVEELIEKWEPPGTHDAADQNPRKDGKLRFLLGPKRSEFRRQLEQVPELSTRLREYDTHPWDVQYILKIIEPSNDWAAPHLKMKFKSPSVSNIESLCWYLEDLRDTSGTVDLTLEASIDTKTYRFSLTDGQIAEIQVSIEGVEVLSFGKGVMSASENKMSTSEEVHNVVVELSTLVPLVNDFVESLLQQPT